MPESKTKPKITRSKKEGIIRVPDNIRQVEKEGMEGSELVYVYKEQLVPDDGHILTDINYWKPSVLKELNKAVQVYLYTKYDQGTQVSFQAIDTRQNVSQEVRTILNGLFTWIASVMQYYYTKKNEIVNAEDYNSVTWDFTTFDATDPQISLQDYMG